MPDPAVERAAYREALARAEAAAQAEAEGETPVTPEAPVELGEAVPVIASDQVVLPVQDVEPTEEVETPAVETALQSEEQLREHIAALEARLAEKDTFIGRQSGEVGELRAAIDELTQRIDAKPAPTIQVPGPQFTITQDMIDNDPGGATEAAFKQGNEPVLHAAYEAWKMEDPATAAVWLAEKKAEQREAALREEFQKTRSELEAAALPAQKAAEEAAVQKTWADAFGLVGQEHPEFIAHAARILEEVAPQYPDVVAQLATGNAATKAQVLKLLYRADRGDNPAAIRELEDAAAAAAAEEAATRLAAAGVVGQTTVGGTARELTLEEQEQERYRQRIAGGISLEKGWTGRKAS